MGDVSIWDPNAHCHISFCEHRDRNISLFGFASLSAP